MTEALPFLVSGEAETDMGLLRSVLSDYHFVERWTATDVEFAPDNFAGLIILGDSSNYRATYRQFDQEREWLETALKTERPVLGICFGAQLLAAHQNRGQRAGGLKGLTPKHLGVCAVDVRGEGASDPVMEPLRRFRFVTMSHEDSFQNPHDAVALAWSAGAEAEHCEAFRVGPPEHAVYGLQFHPEPTLEMLQETRKGMRWFDEIPNTEQLARVVDTGRKVLEAWVRLAVTR